jgi:hypothetical protein
MGRNSHFNPVPHDILYLHEDGGLRIARKASPEMMINVLKASNERHLTHFEGQAEGFAFIDCRVCYSIFNNNRNHD